MGVRFPVTYRAFVQQYGTDIFAGEEVYGVVENSEHPDQVPSVVFATLAERRTAKLDPNIIFIYAVGNGEYYGLLVSQDDDCPVLSLWFMG